MEVDVDGAGQQQLARGVDRFPGVNAGRAGAERGDAPVADTDIQAANPAFQRHLRVSDQSIYLHNLVLQQNE